MHFSLTLVSNLPATKLQAGLSALGTNFEQQAQKRTTGYTSVRTARKSTKKYELAFQYGKHTVRCMVELKGEQNLDINVMKEGKDEIPGLEKNLNTIFHSIFIAEVPRNESFIGFGAEQNPVNDLNGVLTDDEGKELEVQTR